MILQSVHHANLVTPIVS